MRRALLLIGIAAIAWSQVAGQPAWMLVGFAMIVIAAIGSWASGRTAAGSRRDRPGGSRGSADGAGRGGGAIRRGGAMRGSRPGHSPPSTTRFGVEELATRLGVPAADLRAARARYQRFTIPKRSGGLRELLAPDAPAKALQRRILHRLLARVPIHPAVHGFQRDRSIVTNALPHVGRAVVLRLDVADFFPTTATRRIRRLYRVLGWDREAARILTRLTTADGGLPQGAPTSPRLANLVNVQLDARLQGLATANGARYTRYADDLTFSFEADDGDAVRRVIRGAKRILMRDGYWLHEGRKLRVRRQHERQLVTGLVVNRRAALPRSRRRWLRSVEHHLRVGRPATLSEEQLRGWRAFELMVEVPVTPPGAAEEA